MVGRDPFSFHFVVQDDEFRPFIRRLPEWQFWLSTTRATAVALVCSVRSRHVGPSNVSRAHARQMQLFSAFDVPVYWPILVVYFFILFALTMRRQIQCVAARYLLSASC